MATSLGRPFWTMWTSFSSSNLGDGLNLVAYPLLAVSVTDDARLIALVSVFRFLPFLVIGLPAGVILDRFGRRRVVVAAQLARSVALVVPPVALALGRPSITALALSATVVGVGEVFTDGGLPAVLRELVRRDQLEVANARLSAAETTTNMIVGPPLGAALFTLDPALPFVASALLYVGAAAGLVRLPPGSSVPGTADTRFNLEQVTSGLRYVWSHPLIRPLALAVAVFSFVSAAGSTVLVLLATESLGLSPLGFSLLLTVTAVASVAMSFAVSPLIRRFGHSSSMRFSIVTFIGSSLLYGLAPGIGPAIAASMLGGVSAPAWNVVSASVRQRIVPDHIFGRMMTAYLFVAWSMQPAGAFAAGLVAESWGPEVVFVLAGVVVAGLFVGCRPLFHRIDRAMAAETVAGP
ncbi:MAG: MFS transporter [Actinomycetota bacterium]